jgi:putative ABC transport system permease protein
MTSRFFRIFRLLKKNSILNIFGLSIGVAAFVIILLYVKYEQSFDKHHKNYSRIYRIRSVDSRNNEEILDAITAPPPLGPAIISECPEVKCFVRFFTQDESIITIENQKFVEDRLSYVDSTLLNIFTIPLIAGNPENCLDEPNTAIISESNAKKYFGSENPVNRTFKLNDGLIFKITGVFKDIPSNSHFHFNIFMSYNSPHWINTWYRNAWDMYITRTYLLLDKNAAIAKLEGKINRITTDNQPDIYRNETWTRKLQSMASIHLNSNKRNEFEQNGNGKIVLILTIVAFIILIISWINYINISTARSIARAKEVGICKVAGHSKMQLILNFLAESLIMNIVVIAIALGLVGLLITPASGLANAKLSFSHWSLGFSSIIILVFLSGSFLSCLYPAFVLSSFNTVETLKGKVGLSAGSIGLRKILLVLQFVISVAIIMVTMVIYFQTRYMLRDDLGIDIKNTLVIKGNNIEGNDSLQLSRYEAFKQQLAEYPEVNSVAASNSLPANTGFTDAVWSDIQRKDENKELRVLYVDYNYIPALKIPVAAGRNFSKDFPSDKTAAIVSKEAARYLGFDKVDDILNHKTYRVFGDSGKHVVGVTEDFKMTSLQITDPPQIMYLNPAEKRFIAIKSEKEIDSRLIEKAETGWNEFFGDELFRYFILEDSYKKLYDNDVRNNLILAIFSFISIFTAMLGLLGLAYYTITRRTKEIGIRKAIGITVPGILRLILFDFIKLILIASVIALPIGYYFASDWLENYANRISIQWWYFLVPVLFVIVVTVITVGYHTIRIALANPVKALCYE